MNTHSNRQYKVVMTFNSGDTQELNLDLEKLMEGNEEGSDFEYTYAMQDVMDDILDLKKSEMLHFYTCRDHKAEGIGVIVRTN
jgi:hypothetical protein